MTSVPRLALANLWMFRGLVSSILAGDANTDAIQRTTTALTILQAGFKDNVVPGEARAVVNHRLHPAERLEEVLEHDTEVVGDNRVNITVLGYHPPPPVSPYSNDVAPFQIIANSALQVRQQHIADLFVRVMNIFRHSQVFTAGHVTPGTLVANTDTKHYLHLTNNINR